MKRDYLCPNCRSYLNVGEDIVFNVKVSGQKKGLLMLHSELGNYKLKKNNNVEIKKGDVCELFCPVCQANLAVKEFGHHFAKVFMVDEKGKEFDIYFSEIVGVHCTYKIADGLVEPFGEDSENFINHFGENPKY